MKLRYLSVLMLGLSMFSYGQVNTPASGLVTTNSTSTTHNHSEFRQVPVNQTSGLQVQSNFSNPTSNPPTGQHTCKTYELNQAYYQGLGIQNEFNQDYLYHAQNIDNLPVDKTSGVNEISIIFHVVHNPNNPAENVSNAQIMAVYNDLVEDFLLLNGDAVNARTGFGFTPANPNINFCLATQDPFGNPLTEVGVNRVATTEDWYDSDGGEENKMKYSAQGGVDSWGRDDYLNVWICDISNGAGSGTAGYAYRPSPSWGLPSADIDGIVLDYNLGVNNDNVLTHEVGHYLGLDHTWGGSGGCTNDDGFADTPQTAGPSFDYPGSCSGSQQTCGATETQYENYMDYANCTVMFTQDQADYMLYILQNLRQTLMLSPGCDPVDAPPVVDFIADQTIIPVGGTVNFTSIATNAPTSWTWDFGGGATNTTVENPSATFNTVGLYTVTHTATNAFGTGTETKVDYIQVVAPAAGTGCDTLRNYNPADDYYTLYGATGYIQGNENVGGDVLEWAEPYTALATTEVRRLEFVPTRVEDGGGEIYFRVYADNAGQPGAVLVEDTAQLADLNELAWNEFNFTNPVSVTGNFWVGYEVSYVNPTDTFALLTTYNIGTPATVVNFTYMNISGTGWMAVSDVYTAGGGNDVGTAFIMDVLTSNGPDPSTNFTATGDMVCEGGEITVNGSISTNVTNYYWYVTDDPFTTIIETSNTAGNTFTFPTAGNEQIFLFGDGSCKTDGVVLPVTINVAPSATVTATATTCGNNNGTITVSSPAGGDGTTYYYSLDGVNFQTSNTFDNLPAGDYDVYVATVGDNCVTSYTVNIAPSSAFGATASPNQDICPGGSATISASGGVSYQWLDGATIIGTNMSETVSPAAQTQYTCVVTDGSGCQSIVYTTVTVNTPAPAPVISASGSTTICSGTSVDLTSSYPTDNVWSTTETSSTITVNTSGSYSVTYTDGNGCTSTSAPTVVTVTPGPTIASGAVNGPTACATATGSIEITGSGSGDISWTGTASGSQTGITLPYTITGLAAGSYTVTFTDATGCISNQITEALSDPTPPTTPTITAGGPTTFCTGGSVTLTSSYATGNTWSNAATTDAITVSSSGSYSVTYTDGSGCSATSAPIMVTVNTNPTAPTITAGGTTTFCDGGSVTLTSSQGTGNAWSSGETTQAITATTSGAYTVTFTNANGCSATSTPLTVTVNPLPTAPTISAGSATTFCDGGSVTLTSSEASGILWSNNASTQDITVSASGSYTVTFTDGNGCASTSAATDVVVNPLPTVSMSPLTQVCVYDAAFALSGGSPTGGTYSGTGVTANQFDPATAGTGTYTITYSYTDGNGCSGDATTDITVDACLGLEEITSEINVYPNPANNHLIIELDGDFNYSITDARGRVVMEGLGNNKTTVDVQSFEYGVYFVNIHANDKSSTIRIVKQ